MFILILGLLLSPQVQADDLGDAPFCIMDDYGNRECIYYTISSCKEAVKTKPGVAICVMR